MPEAGALVWYRCEEGDIGTVMETLRQLSERWRSVRTGHPTRSTRSHAQPPGLGYLVVGAVE